MHLVLVSAAASLHEVLPALGLLAAHRTTVVPMTAAAVSGAHADADAVLLDGRDRPRAACELAAALARARPGVPRVLVLGPGADLPADPGAGLDGLLLAGAGPAEVDLRLRLAVAAARPHPRPTPPERESPPPPPGEQAVVVGDLVVDGAAFQARVGRRPLVLARREFELLHELAAHAGRPLSRRQLLAGVWGRDYEGSARTVDVHVRQLRRILGAGHRDRIRTVRGVGYVLLAGPAATPAADPAAEGAGDAATPAVPLAAAR